MDGLSGVAVLEKVKLFVGQIPRQLTEEQLLPIFQEAGSVHEISVIKDKATKASRGCCFLIYQTKQEADNAITLFHNKRKLPPLSTPLQVKYAEGELERVEHKLFIGMLPKSVSDADLAAIFSPFGTIKELTVIKGSQASKGCAFLKYETKDQAVAAIKALNDTYKMEGAPTALVVKWADTEKEKQSRKQQRSQIVTTLPPHQTSTYGTVPGTYAVAAPVNGYGYQAQNPYSLAQNPYGLPHYSTTALPGHSAVPGSMVGAVNTAGSVPSAGYDVATGIGSFLATYGTTQPSGYGYAAMPGMQYPGLYQSSFLTQGSVAPVYQTTGLRNVGMGSLVSMVPPAKAAVSSQVEGPPGANLFIYHLPADFSDHDLSTAFRPFGNVISSKVYVDKNTGLSKCFGFVSYDSSEASQAAISALNGAQLGGKRLKVQLKRDSRQNKPY